VFLDFKTCWRNRSKRHIYSNPDGSGNPFLFLWPWAVAGLPQKQKRLKRQQENGGSICPKVLFLIILGFR
jgi:hypothetical protein